MIDVIFGGTQLCVLLHFGPGDTRCGYHNNHRFIMPKDNVSKVTLWEQNSFENIMCEFHAVLSKTGGMAISVRIFLNTPRINRLKCYWTFFGTMKLCFRQAKFELLWFNCSTRPRGYKTWVQSQTQNKAQWLTACGHVSTSSQSLRFILSF